MGVGIPSDELFGALRRRSHQQQQQFDDVQLDTSDVEPDGHTEGDTLLIMATISSSPPSQSNQVTRKDQTTDDEDNKSTIASQSLNQRAQYRIIEVPLSASYHHSLSASNQPSSRDISTIKTSTLLIGLSGLLSDATSILQIVYSQLEEEQRIFGWNRLGLSPVGRIAVASDDSTIQSSLTKAQYQSISTEPSETTMRLSRATADQCQKHAFGGGLRPLGASLMIAGVDNQSYHTTNSECQQGARVAMCETDPSGSWRSQVSTVKCRWPSSRSGGITGQTTNASISPPLVMVSGGHTASQSKLKALMESRLRELYQQSFPGLCLSKAATCNDSGSDLANKVIDGHLFTKRVLQTVIASLVDEWKGRSDGGLTKAEQQQEQVLQMPRMEVVFVSSKRGTFRLSDDDIAALLTQENKVANFA